MAGYKIKIKDLAEYAQTVGRQAEHAINGVRELREAIAKLNKDITQLRHEMFVNKEFERMIVGDNANTIKLDNSIHIELATFAKNKCPHCGSHNLRFTFVPDAFSDSMVNCRDCHNSWKFEECAEDIDSPYVKLDMFRNENRILFEENKDLKYEIEKLRKQAAIDASYMVTVEDLMSRLKGREERIEALKQENNKLESENEQLKNTNKKLDKYIDKFSKDLTPNQRTACDIMAYELNEIEKEKEKLERNVKELQNELEITKKQLELQLLSNTPIQFDKDLFMKNKELKEEIYKLKEENKKLLDNNAVSESDNDFLRHEISEYIDKNNVLKEEIYKLKKKNEELNKDIANFRDMAYEFKFIKKALNIYQNITDLDVTLTRNTAYVRFTDSDDAGRAMVKGSDLDTLCDAYLKYYDAFGKENEDEKNK